MSSNPAPATHPTQESGESRWRAAGITVGAWLAVMWALEVIDLITPGSLDRLGIRPRTLGGLVGIPLAPFLHSGLTHLVANTVPFAVLGFVIAVGSRRRFWAVTVLIGLIAGLGTWLFGTSGSVHIGASGLVFGYLVYLIVRGFFEKRLTWVLGGMAVFIVFGGILWGLVPRAGVSFTGHLFGAIGGVAAAWLLRERTPESQSQ